MDIYVDLHYEIYVIYYSYMAIYVHICHIYAPYMHVPYGALRDSLVRSVTIQLRQSETLDFAPGAAYTGELLFVSVQMVTVVINVSH